MQLLLLGQAADGRRVGGSGSGLVAQAGQGSGHVRHAHLGVGRDQDQKLADTIVIERSVNWNQGKQRPCVAHLPCGSCGSGQRLKSDACHGVGTMD